MRQFWAIMVGLLSLGSACKQAAPRPSRGEASYVGTLAAGFVVLNKAFTVVAFEFRVDGVQLVDTVVSPGGVPAVVLERQIRLTPGRHRLELYDRRLQELHVVVFDVQRRRRLTFVGAAEGAMAASLRGRILRDALTVQLHALGGDSAS